MSSPLILDATRAAVLGMLHLKGGRTTEVIERARREADVYRRCGLAGCIVENYFGTPDDAQAVLADFRREDPGLPYGVNLLDDDAAGFRLAIEYEAAFIQLDSVAGHLPVDEDEDFARFLSDRRRAFGGLVFGGVRFKYQPYRSGRSLADDLALGAGRCDAIVVSGDATGSEPDRRKIDEFAALAPEVPLVVGSGLTAENARVLLPGCVGAIVGSSLKDTGADSGDVDEAHVTRLVEACRAMPSVGRSS